MADLDRVFELGNLRRAYRWLLSNPSSQYKNYFRDSYSAFSIASESLLRAIGKSLRDESYEADHASKILLPKPSGIMRPLTLLNVKDQIVYQAFANIIAEKLVRKTKARYFNSIFANMYAGKSARFFYRKWQIGYRAFGNRISNLHAVGYSHIANFDLTSFYDSIDHQVLRHFLIEIGLEEEASDKLLDLLKVWTSSTWSKGPKSIYHGHGIPQGPLSSGIISEVVLQHLDTIGLRGRTTYYLRYVDDVKIFAKNQTDLRRKLIGLDIASKEIGLFPQASKVNLRTNFDPGEEIKNISELDLLDENDETDREIIRKKLMLITRGGTVTSENRTDFRFLSYKAHQNVRLSSRMFDVFENHPEYSKPITSYFAACKTVPDSIADRLLNFLNGAELYHAATADILEACIGKLSSTKADQVGVFCRKRLTTKSKKLLPIQPTYKVALFRWALRTGKLRFDEVSTIISSEPDWWPQKSMIGCIDLNELGKPNFTGCINDSLRSKFRETSSVAADRLIENSLTLRRPYGDVHLTGRIIMRAAKIVRSSTARTSLVDPILSYVLKRDETGYDWKQLFGRAHRSVERHVITLKKTRESDIDAFLVRLDSFFDQITEIAFQKIVTGKKYPNYGSAIFNPTLVSNLPKFCSAADILHQKRLASFTAHPRSLKTGAPTRRLKHSDFFLIRKAIVAGIDEYETMITP